MPSIRLAPPAYLHEPWGLLDGLPILMEGDNPDGVWLFEAYRAAILWARTPENRRAVLFRSGAPADAPERVRELLTRVRASPAAQAADVGEACRLIADACLAERPRTALHFAFARALADARSPAAAHALAEMTERAGLSAAVEWYERALALARRARSGSDYIRALAGLARLAEKRGDHPAAEAYLLRALRTMRRTGKRFAQGEIVHALFRTRLAQGDAVGAERLIARGRAILRPGVRGAPAFLSDVGRYHLSQARYGAAVEVLSAAQDAARALGHEPEAETLALTAEAWAGTGHAEAYRAAWNDAFERGHASEAVRSILVRAAERMLDSARLMTLRRAGARTPEGDERTTLPFPVWKTGTTGEEAV